LTEETRSADELLSGSRAPLAQLIKNMKQYSSNIEVMCICEVIFWIIYIMVVQIEEKGPKIPQQAITYTLLLFQKKKTCSCL
jgi:hypothetical protein